MQNSLELTPKICNIKNKSLKSVNSMDNIDVKLLAAMENNSRISLKNLARDLSVKTSTIYHRLGKLKKNNTLDRFTIVINPEAIGLSLHTCITIRLKKMVIGKLDTMFLESFAKFLSDQFGEIMFSGVGEDEQIYLLASFRDQNHFSSFDKQLKENPYVDTFKVVNFNRILKGKKVFAFIPELFVQSEKGNVFDDDVIKQEKTEDKEEHEKDENEVFF
jgi:DNA-binding Lrp family transcriptional regulator